MGYLSKTTSSCSESLVSDPWTRRLPVPKYFNWSDWTMFTAATVTDSETRDRFINMVWSRANSNISDSPFPTTYNLDSGAALPNAGGVARFVCFSSRMMKT